MSDTQEIIEILNKHIAIRSPVLAKMDTLDLEKQLERLRWEFNTVIELLSRKKIETIRVDSIEDGHGSALIRAKNTKKSVGKRGRKRKTPREKMLDLGFSEKDITAMLETKD